MRFPLLSSIFLTLCVLWIPSASAANRYWVGTAGGEWTDSANWSTAANACGVSGGASVPGSADVAYFVSNCTNDVSINPATIISGINMAAGYTGTGTLAGPVTLTTFIQAGGAFVLHDQSLTINGAVTISGGTFHAGTGTVILGGAAATINVNETLTFYNLTFHANASATKTIAASDKLIVQNTLTLTDGLVSQTTISASGTILAQGDILQESTFDGGTGRIEIAGTGPQLFTGNATNTAGILPLLTISKDSGTLTLSGTIRTTKNWTYRRGTMDSTTNDSTVVFAATLTLSGSQTLNNVRFDGNVTAMTVTIPAGVTLTTVGTLTFDQTGDTGLIRINTGTIAAHGDITIADTTLDLLSSATMQISGTGDQLFLSNATTSIGGSPNIQINKTSGTLTLSGTIRTQNSWIYTAGTVDPGTSTVVFYRPLAGVSSFIEGSHTLYNVRFDSPYTKQFPIASSTTLMVNGTLELLSGYIKRGTIIALGNVTHGSLFDGGNGSLVISGDATRTITLTGSSLPALTINAPNVTIEGPSYGTLGIQGNFSQSAGVFMGGVGNVHVAGDFCRTGGTFTAPSGQLSVGRNFCATEATFIHNNGTLLLNGTSQTLALPSPLFNVIFNDGLVGRWGLDETSGTTADDSSPFANRGTHLNGPTISTDVPSVNYFNARSLLFDGTDDTVDIEHHPSFSFDNNQSFTLGTWFNTSHNFASKAGLIISKRGRFYQRYSLGLSTSNIVYCSLSDGVVATSVLSLAALNDGQWHFATCVIDRSGQQMSVYIDGNLTNVVDISNVDTFISSYPLHLGTEVYGSNYYYNGLADDIRIYSRTLSVSEISSLATGVERPASGITYTLGGPLTVAGTLTVNNVTLDQYGNALTYRTLVNNGGTITDSYVPFVAPPPPGGGRGSRSPGRGGDAPQIDPSTRTLLPAQSDTVSPLYLPSNNIPPAPAGVTSPMRARLAARIEKRIAQFPRLRTMLLKVLERVDRRLMNRIGN